MYITYIIMLEMTQRNSVVNLSWWIISTVLHWHWACHINCRIVIGLVTSMLGLPHHPHWRWACHADIGLATLTLGLPHCHWVCTSSTPTFALPHWRWACRIVIVFVMSSTLTLGLLHWHWACHVNVGLAALTLGLPRQRWAHCVDIGLAALTRIGEPKEWV
jgi:hypothetical protein